MIDNLETQKEKKKNLMGAARGLVADMLEGISEGVKGNTQGV